MQVLPRFRRLSTWPGPPGYFWYSEIMHASLNVTSKPWGGCAGHHGGIDQRGGATAGAIHPRTAPACRRRASGRHALLRSHRRDSGGGRARDLSPLRAVVPLGDGSSARARLEQTALLHDIGPELRQRPQGRRLDMERDRRRVRPAANLASQARRAATGLASDVDQPLELPARAPSASSCGMSQPRARDDGLVRVAPEKYSVNFMNSGFQRSGSM
jgi:hypothetical protein